ncbi:hypothetical protein B9Z55_016768 [Caenorhabditis nigoni]|uniref:G-protein coupled receptors family 1 profile domain-containing protein n=1 Tax=Caenorhabditis nigoni TaxID=1611254 RepID=A0A2G5T6Z0_9PELO|nr:hypothetical protein B9Z55_016768 [Caenorhabditis nigoni]
MLQIILPIFIFCIYLAIIFKILYMKRFTLSDSERSILKQVLFVFVAFQTPSLIFLSFQSIQITNTGAFLVKRFVNTMEIIAGAATPSFFFFTSKEIRKLVSIRVSAASSQNGSNVRERGIRSL